MFALRADIGAQKIKKYLDLAAGSPELVEGQAQRVSNAGDRTQEAVP